MKLGPETQKAHYTRTVTKFYDKYMFGIGLDIGYRGSLEDAEPVLSTARGIELDTPGYDGFNLPVKCETQDYVFASHCLEHVTEPHLYIREWFRVIKTGGHLVVCVPHQFLYEKKRHLPSRYNMDHKRFYTPAGLLAEVELALEPNTYRVVHLRDNDDGFNYNLPPDVHSSGGYEIELVIKKIKKPTWEIA